MTGQFLTAGGTMLARSRVGPLVLILLFSIIIVPSRFDRASAGFLSEVIEGLEVAGRAALRAADNASVIATVRRLGTDATVLSVDEAGALTFTKWTAGVAGATVLLKNSDNIASLEGHLGAALYVTPEVVADHADQLKNIIQVRHNQVHVVSSNESGRVTVELKTHADGSSLVVRKSDYLTFSTEAWAKRALLDQPLMRDLARRFHIIVVAPRSDVLQRQAFLEKFGSRVEFVDSDERLTAALRKARQRLVVVVGHVEDEAFVLQAPNNALVLQQKLDNVHQAIDDAQSVALLMGCNVACDLGLTGPTQVIDAYDVIRGLSEGPTANTPMAFLVRLAEKVGPMHIDTDFFGRLRAVSSVTKTTSDRVATGASFGRVLFSFKLNTPLTLDQVVLSVIVAVPWLTLMGWILLFLFGLGPRRAWRLTKEAYAASTGRGEEEIDKLSHAETILLLLFGPAIQIFFAIARLLDLTITVVSLFVAFLIYPWICVINPVALRFVDTIEQERDPAYSRSFNSGRGIALIAIGVAAVIFAVTCVGSDFFHFQVTGNSIVWTAIAASVAGLTLAPLLTRQVPKLVTYSFLASHHGLVRIVLKLYWLIRASAALSVRAPSKVSKPQWQKSDA